jgi:hypothetical protein
MRVKMTLLMLLAWAGGCSFTLDMGETVAKINSVPEGMFAWRATVSGFKSTGSIDPVKMVELAGQGITNIVGMLPKF